MEQRIPKIIHLVWFGKKEYPELVKKCLKSWDDYLPDYEIKIWNENSFDVGVCPFVKEAYNSQKWAFVSDYVRLWALYNYGGIYMDTDVEVVRPLDAFLEHDAFSGFEAKDSIPTGIIGAAQNNEVIKMLLDYYTDKHFVNDDGSLNQISNVTIITEILSSHGLVLNGKFQNIAGFALYPQIVFCPNNFLRIFNITSRQTYTIHHFTGSWTNSPITKKTLKLNVKRYFVGVLRDAIGTQRTAKIIDKVRNQKWI